MSLTLYMQNFSAPVRAVLFTAEAIGITLQKKIIDLSKGEHLTPEFCQINPQHTIPTLVDNGAVIWDSHAINAYLASKYARDDSFYPKDLAKRAMVDQRLHFDSGAIFSWLRIVARGVKYRGLTALTSEQIDGITDGYEHLNNFLKGNLWVTGDTLTIADFSLITSVTSLDLVVPVDSTKFPHVANWLERAKTLPFYHLNEVGLKDLRKTLQVLIK